MHTAVLFLVFNRPSTTKKVFETIRQVKPPRLYVAADGPRSEYVGEIERCNEVRKISTTVDWPCQVRTLFRDENLGCKYAVSSAITWFFDNEEEGIVLEDDILSTPDFFLYCEFLLNHYRDNPKVMMISGCNPVSRKYVSNYSYDFSLYTLVWGWASWRRAWNYYDVNMCKWPLFNSNKQLLKLPKVRKVFEVIWRDIYEKTYRNEINTWDYQWFFSIHYNHSYIIIPNINYIKNIGFGMDATHATGYIPKYVKDFEMGRNPRVFLHPPKIENNETIDRLFEETVFNVNKFTYIKSIFKTLPGFKIVMGLYRQFKAILLRENHRVFVI